MTGEEYRIREVGESEVGRIARFFARHAYKKVTEEYLRRKYFENPAGRGRIFVMEDSAEKIKGTLGYIPHLLSAPKTEPLVVMESVDLFIDPEARGKKMFPRLQGSVMKRIGHPLIAFPNKRSERITLELGWERYGSIENWVLAIGPPWISFKQQRGFLLTLTWSLFRFWSRICLAGRSKKIRMKAVNRYEEHFDDMFHSTRVGRSPENLNWRYEGNPLRPYELFEFESEGKRVGYCVLSQEEDAIFIYDFFSCCDERSCMRALVSLFAGRGFKWLRFRGINLRLWKFGFVKWPSTISLISYDLPRGKWTLTLGDSDW